MSAPQRQPYQPGSVVHVEPGEAGSFTVFCDYCHYQVGGTFMVEGHAYRHACTHYVSKHMTHAVSRPS